MVVSNEKKPSQHLTIPILPLRDVVIYPYMVVPLFVGRERSIKALEVAMSADKQILLVTQKDAGEDQPMDHGLYTVGTLSTVLQFLKLPDGTVKVLIEGVGRGKIKRFVHIKEYLLADVERLEENIVSLTPIKQKKGRRTNKKKEMAEIEILLNDHPLLQTGGGDPKTLEGSGNHQATDTDTESQNYNVEILMRLLKFQFEQYVKLNQKIPSEIMASILAIEEGSRLADTIAAHLNIKLEKKQKLLETIILMEKLEALVFILENEINFLKNQKKIYKLVKERVEQKNRLHYLLEQKAVIQQELNDMENIPNEFEALANKIVEAHMPKEVEKKCKLELSKLEVMPIHSAESTVSRNYLDVMLSLPWNQYSKKKVSLQSAKEVLDAEHYGLEDVKERILEYLAVQKRVGLLKDKKDRKKEVKSRAKPVEGKRRVSELLAAAGSPVLCLVGPPGVGKTSLVRSIANSIGREYIRISLGGVRDEAEIRGHRRTYVGAMPGKIIQRLIKVKKNNPVILLDEIDKISMDYHKGDPASALLEVLDREQNSEFNDHYLEVDYNLSDIMFIATANTLDIPSPLRDRLEVIRIPGYTEDEKINIAMGHLVLKQMVAAGLDESEVEISKEAIQAIVRYYTREAGVRNLDRAISKICRKLVKKFFLKEVKVEKIWIEADKLEDYLGVKRYRHDMADQQDQIGQVKGLAWTEVGGELLSIEAVATPGTGKTIYTGQLGEIMQESIQAALTVVRSRSLFLGIPKNFFTKNDIHIHVPEGATPKDGPSAGISMCTALVSVLTHLPVRADFAMTGEITLRGEILPIGGLKEKLLAAHRSNIKNILIPIDNVKDLKEIPDNVKQDLAIIPVRWIEEVLRAALNGYPQHLPSKHKKGVSALSINRNISKKRKLEKIEDIKTH